MIEMETPHEFAEALSRFAEHLLTEERKSALAPLIMSLYKLVARRFKKQLTFFMRHGFPKLGMTGTRTPDSADIQAALDSLIRFHMPNFGARFETIANKAYRAGVADAAAQVGAELSPTAAADAFRRAITLDGILDLTTESVVRGVIEKGIKDGLSRAELQRAIRDQWKNWYSDLANRAAMIAESEIAAMYNRGSLARARAAGVLLKEWSPDPSACLICLGNAGEAIAIDEPFASGDDAPPAHPNCRCGLVYSTGDGEGEAL